MAVASAGHMQICTENEWRLCGTVTALLFTACDTRSRNQHLKTVGFCCSKVSCRHALADGIWHVHIREKMLDAGMVMCLVQDADLYMAQLMPLPLTVSCSSKSRLVLRFWCRFTRVVPDRNQEGRKMVCVCVCV